MKVEEFELQGVAKVPDDGTRVRLHVEGEVQDGKIEPDVVRVIDGPDAHPRTRFEAAADALDPEGTNVELRAALADFAASQEGFAGYSADELRGVARDG
jgi:hypothetical protein